MTPRPTRTLAIGFAGLGLAGALAGCTTAAVTGDAGGGSGGSNVSAAAGPYRDGTYTADGRYLSPAGEQTVTVKVTLADDKITAVTVTPHATDPTAKGYQGLFVQGIAAQVVGKQLDQLNVSRVAGSSLTSGGFNQAIAAIENDAAA
ncbi:MAG TPA: FMN-binding protein [Pseudolysinimonas sp.]|jgi:uncharacterized protein with FMN-binding domain